MHSKTKNTSTIILFFRMKTLMDLAPVYVYAQVASQAAERLLHKHSRYYRDLYSRDLEMLYFLVEPIIDRVDVHNQYHKSDNDIVSDILRIVR